MADQRVIVVSEVAPRLTEFTGAAAKKFLRDYVAYENRLDATDSQMPLKRCLDPDDLETLIQCSEDMKIEVVREPAAVAEPAATAATAAASSRETAAAAKDRGRPPRRNIQTPLRDLMEDELSARGDAAAAEKGDGSDDEVRSRDQVVRLSNAHIEAMLVHVLGPESTVEATRLLQDVKMSKDPVFSRLGIATNYVREWKDALRWCKNFLPPGKAMVKIFLRNVVPRKLAQTLEDLGLKKIETVMIQFVAEYQRCVKAKKVLTGMEAPVPIVTGGGQSTGSTGGGGGARSSGGNKPVSGASGPTPAPTSAKTDTKKKSDDSWKLKATCYKCGKTGHISPNCPDADGGEKQNTKKLGTMLLPNKPKGPYLTVDVCGPIKDGSRKLRLMANMDSGAECNVVGRKWVQHLEDHGGVVEQLSVPVSVEWLDKKSSENITESIQLTIEVAECNCEFVVTLLIVDWEIDHLVIGWETMAAQGLLKRLEDFLVVQRQMNVAVGAVQEDVNMVVEDMDGRLVTSDSLRFDGDADGLPDLVDANSESESDLEVAPQPESILNADQQRELDELIEQFSDIFVELPAGSANVEAMTITAKPGWKRPPMEPFRRYSPKVEAAIKMDLQKQLDAGIIEKSDLVNGCYVHAVPKPDSDSGYRFCVDFRAVNDGVETNPYPLPPISVILLSISVAMFFARLDLKSGYWQFPVAENCKPWLAFFALGQMYTYSVVPMGFVESSFHVQREMCKLFAEYFGRGIFVYLDDIIIYAKTWEEFMQKCRAALSILRAARLFCKRSKCAFGLPSLQILGHVVSRDGLKMSEGRKEAVMAVPFPRNARELRRFLGMCNYMRAFIPRYSLLAKPLSAHVNTPVGEWPREEMISAFKQLQEAVVNQLSLAHLDYSVPLVLQTDASTVGVGAALLNRRADGDRVIGCCSHAFTATENRWKTIEQESFAIVFAVLHWYAVLYGHHFVIETDHRNLVYIHSGSSAKVTRWSLLLQSLCYAVSHIPGALNVIADALSRTPARIGHALHALRLSDFDPPSWPMRLGAVRAVASEMSSDVARGLFLQHHNDTVGHRGLHSVLRALQQLGHCWTRMSRDCARWIAECPECQKYRLAAKPVVAIPSPIASFQIFEELGVDFIGPLPKDVLDNCYIVNFVCMTTHYCELFAVESATAVIAAHCLLDVVARYGCFRRLRSDRGTHFVNEIIMEFCRLFEIQQVLTLPERPQANAIVERNGGEATRHLRALVAARDLRSMWSVMLPLTRRIINNTWKKAINNTPHRLIHWAPTDLDRGLFAPFQANTVIPPLTNAHVRALQTSYERLLDETSVFVIKEQEVLQREHSEIVPTEFEVGGFVLVSYLVRPPSKLAARWAGPFKIVSKEGNNVRLEDLTGGPEKTVDVSRLKHFIVAPGVDVQAVAAADLGEAQVQAVLGHRGTARNRRELQFQLQWTDGDVTWESWERVRRLEAVDVYIRNQSGGSLKALLPK